MFRIKKDGLVVALAATLLVLSIFSASKIEPSDITGAATAITGMQTSPDCPSFPVKRIQELRNEIEDRLYVLRLLGVPAWPTFMEIPSEGKVSDAAYVRELRGYLMQLTRYFWNIERVDPAPNLIYGIHTTLDNYAASDAPASYDAIPEELFQQALGPGHSGWTNQNPECISNIDLDELEKATYKLRWIFIPMPNAVERTYLWTRLFPRFMNVEWYEIKRGEGEDYTLDGSWDNTLNDFKYIQRTGNPPYCPVYDEGIGSLDGNTNKYSTSRYYAYCKVKLDISSLLNSNINIEEAKAIFFMSYAVSNAQLTTDLVGKINLGDIAMGYNLIDINIPEDGIWSSLIESALDDVKPNVAKDGRSYGKGFEGYLGGVFVSPYAENNPPVVEVKLKANEQSTLSISSTAEFNVCDNLECNIEVSDTDKKDTTFSIEYTIDGGHGTLAKTQPEISGKTECYSNPCAKQLIIPKEYTHYKDKIYCEARAFDGHEWSEMDSAYATIAGRCSQ